MTSLTRRKFQTLAALTAMSFTGPATLRAAAAAAKDNPEAQMKKMVEALKNRSYEAFLEGTDDTMKAALTKQMFEGVCGQLSEPLGKGYRTTRLGQLKQLGSTVHLWKLEISGLEDQTLIKMSVKDGLVNGFLLQ